MTQRVSFIIRLMIVLDLIRKMAGGWHAFNAPHTYEVVNSLTHFVTDSSTPLVNDSYFNMNGSNLNLKFIVQIVTFPIKIQRLHMNHIFPLIFLWISQQDPSI